MSSQVLDIYNQLDRSIQADPSLRTKLHGELSKLVSASYTHAMNSDEGYCYKFNIPTTAVMNLYKLLHLDPKTVGKAFQADWKFPSNAMMYNDPYYQILLLLIYYGIKKNDDQLINNSLFLLLQKLWNGRKYAYIRYCDKRIMNYVVNHMVNKKHNVSKFDSPLSLLKNYYIPTLLKKYRPEIERDVYRLRQLFMQSWARLDQLFVYNPVIDPETGEKRAQGGLLPLYMKAKKDGLFLTTPTIMKGDEDIEFDQYSTISNRDKIVTQTADFISMNAKPQYPNSFIAEVNKATKVSMKVVETMLSAMHNHAHYNLIHDALSIILSRTKVSDKNDICSKDFMTNVKRNIVSSKNTSEIRNLQKILSELSDKIFKENLGLDFNKYSRSQQIQICNIILYGLVYNLRKYNCQGSSF